MKRRDLIKRLSVIAQQRGESFSVSEGGRHSKVKIGSTLVIVPRHSEINEITARAILRQAKGEA